MGFLDSLKRGLQRSREAINEIFYMGGEVDEDFWEDLEDTLVMGDMGAEVAMRVTDDLREQAARENLSRAEQLRDALARRLAAEFPEAGRDPFSDLPSTVLFVGINGAGKTTTVGKLAGRTRSAPPRSSSSRSGAGARASTSSPASAGPTPRASATTWWTRPSAAGRSSRSSTPPGASTPPPTSCASSPRS